MFSRWPTLKEISRRCWWKWSKSHSWYGRRTEFRSFICWIRDFLKRSSNFYRRCFRYIFYICTFMDTTEICQSSTKYSDLVRKLQLRNWGWLKSKYKKCTSSIVSEMWIPSQERLSYGIWNFEIRCRNQTIRVLCALKSADNPTNKCFRRWPILKEISSVVAEIWVQVAMIK